MTIRPSRLLLIMILFFSAGSVSSCNYAVGTEIQNGSSGGLIGDDIKPRHETSANRSLFRLPPVLRNECDANTGNGSGNIVADGVAPVIASDFSAAREEAVTDALMKAMEIRNGVHISGSTVVSDGLLLSSDVESRVNGFVSGYSIKSESNEGGMYYVRVCSTVSPASSIAAFPFGITSADEVEIRGSGEGCPFAYESLAGGLRMAGASVVPAGGNVRLFFSCAAPKKLDETPAGLIAFAAAFSIHAERVGIKGNICEINDTRVIGLGNTEETALKDLAGNGGFKMRAALLGYCMVTPISLIRLKIMFPAQAADPRRLIEKIKSIRWTKKVALISSDGYADLLEIYSVLPPPVFAKRLSVMENVRILSVNGGMIEIYFSGKGGNS